MADGVQVAGARELRKALARAGADLQDFTDLHAAIGRYVAARAAAMAPRRTGTLSASIRASKAKSSATLRAGSAKVRYAGVIHWGWPRRSIRPQTFLVDAAAVTEPTWSAWYMRKVEDIIGKVASS
jgi:hypothetical protein